MVKELKVFCDHCGKRVDDISSKQPQATGYWHVRPIRAKYERIMYETYVEPDLAIDICNECFNLMEKGLNKSLT